MKFIFTEKILEYVLSIFLTLIDFIFWYIGLVIFVPIWYFFGLLYFVWHLKFPNLKIEKDILIPGKIFRD